MKKYVVVYTDQEGKKPRFESHDFERNVILDIAALDPKLRVKSIVEIDEDGNSTKLQVGYDEGRLSLQALREKPPIQLSINGNSEEAVKNIEDFFKKTGLKIPMTTGSKSWSKPADPINDAKDKFFEEEQFNKTKAFLESKGLSLPDEIIRDLAPEVVQPDGRIADPGITQVQIPFDSGILKSEENFAKKLPDDDELVSGQEGDADGDYNSGLTEPEFHEVGQQLAKSVDERTFAEVDKIEAEYHPEEDFTLPPSNVPDYPEEAKRNNGSNFYNFLSPEAMLENKSKE
jgi:hypothetical protein